MQLNIKVNDKTDAAINQVNASLRDENTFR